MIIIFLKNHQCLRQISIQIHVCSSCRQWLDSEPPGRPSNYFLIVGGIATIVLFLSTYAVSSTLETTNEKKRIVMMTQKMRLSCPKFSCPFARGNSPRQANLIQGTRRLGDSSLLRLSPRGVRLGPLSSTTLFDLDRTDTLSDLLVHGRWEKMGVLFVILGEASLITSCTI